MAEVDVEKSKTTSLLKSSTSTSLLPKVKGVSPTAWVKPPRPSLNKINPGCLIPPLSLLNALAPSRTMSSKPSQLRSCALAMRSFKSLSASSSLLGSAGILGRVKKDIVYYPHVENTGAGAAEPAAIRLTRMSETPYKRRN